MQNSITGLMEDSLSRQPDEPISMETELKVAPNAAVAKTATAASAVLDEYAEIMSPGLTASFLRAFETKLTSSYSCAKVRERKMPVSLVPMTANLADDLALP